MNRIIRILVLSFTGSVILISCKSQENLYPNYLVIDNKPIKLENKRQAIRFLKKLNSEKAEISDKKFRLMNKDSARIKYGIEEKFMTLELID